MKASKIIKCLRDSLYHGFIKPEGLEEGDMICISIGDKNSLDIFLDSREQTIYNKKSKPQV